MTLNEWAKRNSGYLALASVGVTTAGFLLLPLYLSRDVNKSLAAQPASSARAPTGWPWLDLP
jgi:hypothetical protein